MNDFFTNRDKFFLSIVLAVSLVALGMPYLRGLIKQSSVLGPSFESFNGKEIIKKDVSLYLPEVKVLRSRRLNVNDADVDQLKKIGGVGEVIARRIVNYRNDNGKFKKLEELGRVKGVGDFILENIKKEARVD